MHKAVALALVLVTSLCGPARSEPPPSPRVAPAAIRTAEGALAAVHRAYQERVATLILPDHRRLLDLAFQHIISLQVGLVQPPGTPPRAFHSFARPEVGAADTVFFPIFGRPEAVKDVEPAVWVLSFSTLSSVYDFYLDADTGTILFVRGVLEG